jgi:hypothetical protein
VKEEIGDPIDTKSANRMRVFLGRSYLAATSDGEIRDLFAAKLIKQKELRAQT